VTSIGPVVRVMVLAYCVARGPVSFQWSGPTLGGGPELNACEVQVPSIRPVLTLDGIEL
jgi:hypothetical protein